MDDKIKVRIRCHQEVQYDQVVELTREEFEDLQREVEENDGCFDLFSDPVSDILDLTDLDANDGVQDVELEVLEG